MATTNDKILNALDKYNSGLQTKLSNTYVTKVSGKSLSTNDFTDEYKDAIDGLSSISVDINALTDTFVTQSTIDGLSSIYVQQAQGKSLSTNDFTDALKNKLDAVDTGTYVTKVSGKSLSTNDFTNDYKSAIDGMSSIYAKKVDCVSAMRYKGSVLNYAALPTDTSILSIGDVYNISVGGGSDGDGTTIKSGDNVAWTGTGWDDFGGAIDLSNYVEKVSGKNLSTNDFTDALKDKLDAVDTDTYVTKVAGKGLSENDFTNADKTKLDLLSTDTQTVNLNGYYKVYVGNTQPADNDTIWFDTSGY